MSIERGKLLACDRCGFTVFLKSTGESKQMADEPHTKPTKTLKRTGHG